MDIKAVARWVVYLSLFAIPLLPWYVANDLFFPFITGKGFAFRILVEIATAGYLILALADKEYRPRFSWTFVLYTAFVIWMFVADLFAVNPSKAFWSNFERMDGWVTLIHVFLFFFVSSAVLGAKDLWRWWWYTFLGVAALMCFYGALQLGHALPIHQGSTRVDSRFGNAIYFAVYLLFACAASVWLGLKEKSWVRWLLFIFAFVCAFFIYETETRGAIFGLIVGVVVASVLFMLEAGRNGRRIAAGFLVLAILATGGLFLARHTSFVTHNSTLTRIASVFEGSEFTTRLTLWHMAAEGIAERPVFGWGQEGFNYIFYKFYDPSLYAQEPWFDRAHNEYVDWAVAGGIPALILFLAALLAAAWAIYRSDLPKEERILLIAALAAYVAQGMTVFDNLFSYVPFAAILAIAHYRSSRPWTRLTAIAPMSESNLQMTAPIIAVLMVVVIWFVNVPNIAAASELVHAIGITSTDISPNMAYFQQALGENTFGKQEIREQLMIFADNIAGAQGHPSDALNQLMTYALGEFGKQVAAEPLDTRLRFQYAIGYRAAGDSKDALTQFELARQQSPKKQPILIEEAIAYWDLGQTDKVEQLLTEAYQTDPSFDQLAPYAAAGKIANGNLAGGKQFLMQRLGTTTVDNQALLLAYYQAKDYPDLILVLEAQVRNQGNSAESEYRLASAYVSAGNIPAARAEVQQALADHPETAAQGAAFLSQLK